jgi:hypothetical protein
LKSRGTRRCGSCAGRRRGRRWGGRKLVERIRKCPSGEKISGRVQEGVAPPRLPSNHFSNPRLAPINSEMVAPTSAAPPLPASTLISLLDSLSTQLLSSRLDDPTSFDPQTYLAQSAPLFAALHGLNRHNLQEAKECRGRTQEARLEMDSAHLRLQVRLSTL